MKRERTPEALKSRAVAHLARREHSRAELRGKLLASGAESDEVEKVLDELATLGYLSDSRFASAFVAGKAGHYSRRAIADTLKSKGVPATAAAEAILAAGLNDEAALVAVWRRRFNVLPADDREKARQVRFLQSRGFALSAILKLLRSGPSADDGSQMPR